MLLIVEQFLNGLQFGLLLFLLAAGLTLVFGIMDFVNLAHGSLYMMGAYFAATFVAWTGNFIFGVLLALGATLLLGVALEFIGALGINIKLLYTLVFGLGAALAGLAGLMQAPILTVQIGMGENILILAFVIIVIGGIGSIRGAFLAAIFVGIIDTLGRAFLPDLLRQILRSAAAATPGPPLSSVLIYLLMAIVLVLRPEGLFPANRR